MKRFRQAISLFSWPTVLALALASCGGQEQQTEPPSAQVSGLSGTIRVDGSSTVYPLTEAVAEEFQKANPNVRVTVGTSGTGGGFKKFCAGEIDICDASRPIKEEEAKACAAGGINPIELPVAYDGLAVLVNPANDWVDHLTVEELAKIWEPESKVKKWSDVRKGWPNAPIVLYGPGTDSGTFDYFTEEILGESGRSRSDFMASEDDNVLVHGISGDKNALGYFGYAYYVENQDKLKLVPIDSGKGPVLPSEKTIREKSYAPLSRPLFIYVNAKQASRPEMDAFVQFYLKETPTLVHDVGYIALEDAAYTKARERFASALGG